MAECVDKMPINSVAIKSFYSLERWGKNVNRPFNMCKFQVLTIGIKINGTNVECRRSGPTRVFMCEF